MKYSIGTEEDQFEPGSEGRILKNKLGMGRWIIRYGMNIKTFITSQYKQDMRVITSTWGGWSAIYSKISDQSASAKLRNLVLRDLSLNSIKRTGWPVSMALELATAL